MKPFLDCFYDYVKSPEGFNCVEFQYQGITYQLVSGASLCFVDCKGQNQRIQLPDNIEEFLDAKVMPDGKSLREIWRSVGGNELFPDFY